MAKSHDHRSREPQRGEERPPEESRRERIDDPEEHRAIEKMRFQGSTRSASKTMSTLYANAREQWYRLPGSVVRPSMDPVIREGDGGEQTPDGEGPEGDRRTER